jgi:RNA polymerase subunit RPABC4/transcription elongation factor Spt4
MKYCTFCHRLTPGDPLFCNTCGRSYDVKLCPRLHVNPRAAQVCSLCGSREMSTPQPRPSFWRGLLVRLLALVPGVVLLALSLLLLLAFIQTLLTDQQVQGQLVALALLVSVLWFVYMRLPRFVRSGIRQAGKRVFKRRTRERPGS